MRVGQQKNLRNSVIFSLTNRAHLRQFVGADDTTTRFSGRGGRKDTTYVRVKFLETGENHRTVGYAPTSARIGICSAVTAK